MLELLSNTLQRTEQDCTATALVEKLGKNATCLKVQANLDLTGRPGARNLCPHYVKWNFFTFCGLTGSNTYP